MQNNVTEAAEIDSTNYQWKLMSTRDGNVVLKSLGSLNKSMSFLRVTVKDRKPASSIKQKVKLLNDIFQSVYSPEESFKVKDIQPKKATLTNFSVNRTDIYQNLIEINVKELRGP